MDSAGVADQVDLVLMSEIDLFFVEHRSGYIIKPGFDCEAQHVQVVRASVETFRGVAADDVRIEGTFVRRHFYQSGAARPFGIGRELERVADIVPFRESTGRLLCHGIDPLQRLTRIVATGGL